jgi:hypothetical protein
LERDITYANHQLPGRSGNSAALKHPANQPAKSNFPKGQKREFLPRLPYILRGGKKPLKTTPLATGKNRGNSAQQIAFSLLSPSALTRSSTSFCLGQIIAPLNQSRSRAARIFPQYCNNQTPLPSLVPRLTGGDLRNWQFRNTRLLRSQTNLAVFLKRITE